MTTEWILVGEVTAPQGVKGELRVLPLTDFPERLLTMQECRLCTVEHGVVRYRVLSVRPHKSFYLFRLEGIADRNAAEKLRGAQMVISREEVKPLPEGRYYQFELVGMAVQTTSGESVGTLVEVLTGAGNDVFVIRRPGRRDALIPAVRQFVVNVDIAQKRMTIAPIPGMLDEEESYSRED